MSESVSAPATSRLVPVGLGLVVTNMIGGGLFRSCAAQGRDAPHLVAGVVADLFNLGFFVGIACLIIGIRRNSRWKRDAASAAGTPPPT